MNEVLNNLIVGETLYTTSNGTKYLFTGRSKELGVKYSINQQQKLLPLNTIIAALTAFNNSEEITSEWYRNYNQMEYKTRSCNLSVLKELIHRVSYNA